MSLLPLNRVDDAWYVFITACLKQQHADVGIFG
jgi:hypothetical protein